MSHPRSHALTEGEVVIVEHCDLSDLEKKDAPMPHHEMGLSYTASGYGRKIPTRMMVKIPGSPRWRRVYCAIFSNIGTLYVLKRKDWIVINEYA